VTGGSSLLVALVLAFGGVLGIAGSAHGAFPGENGRIAYTEEASNKLFTVNPDGSDARRLMADRPGHVTEVEPSYSADGRRIAFASYRGISIVNADGSRPRRVKGVDGLDPSFSPGGKRLVYQSEGEIWRVRVDGTRRKPLTGGRRHPAFHPAWSPDGRHIVFSRVRRLPGGSLGDWNLYTMRPDGSEITRLTRMHGSELAADWSPDGREVAFARAYREERSGIWAVSWPDGEVRGIYNATEYMEGGPAFSPDGSQIAFWAGHYPNGALRTDILTVPASGMTTPDPGIATAVVESGFYPAWQPR
jgi:Tol biopolymer transport system component